ncbi:hypothetical protein [Streptomyces sp. NPDC051016]|uniref:hypothetical protein n=1 Tax=Streptomyces sp. NPDC051016 TaxID=3365638 RepID=UPI0037B5DF92
MARLIFNPTLWQLHQVEGRSDAITDWVRANGIEPDEVSVTHNLTIEDRPDGQVICCTAIARNENGRPYATADGEAAMEERVVPLVVEPPEGWPVYAVPDSPRERP